MNTTLAKARKLVARFERARERYDRYWKERKHALNVADALLGKEESLPVHRWWESHEGVVGATSDAERALIRFVVKHCGQTLFTIKTELAEDWPPCCLVVDGITWVAAFEDGNARLIKIDPATVRVLAE